MIETQTCCLIRCDKCKDHLHFDYVPHFDDAVDARETAEGSEWWSDGTIDLCYSCKTDQHAFVPGPDSAEDCWRCGNPADEHEPMEATP